VVVGDHDVGAVQVLGHGVKHREAGHPGGVGPARVGLDEQGLVAGVGGVPEQVSGYGAGEHRDERAVTAWGAWSR
jgi:hypothetical protein